MSHFHSLFIKESDGRCRGNTLPGSPLRTALAYETSAERWECKTDGAEDEVPEEITSSTSTNASFSSSSTSIYVQRCKALRMVPDPAVLACFETGWRVLAISPENAREGVLTPLLDILGGRVGFCNHVKELRLVPAPSLRETRRRTSSGDIDARCVSKILSTNKTIVEVDLSYLGLGDTGIQEIASVLKLSSNLQVLRLSHNQGGRSSYTFIERAIGANTSLKVLDVSSNRLGYNVVQRLRSAGKRQHPHEDLTVIAHGNHVVEEYLNALTHAIGFIMAVIGVVNLFWHTSASTSMWWSCVIYSCCLLCVFASSTLFHASFDCHLDDHDFWKLCDHAAIFLLVAGSGSPFFHVALADSSKAWCIAGLQWGIAVLGIWFGIYATHNKVPHKLKIEMMLNCFQALLAFGVYDELKEALDPQCFHMIILGCILYSFGALFFVAEHTVHPIAHAIWHIFVVAAAAVHYFAVLSFVKQVQQANVTCHPV